MLLLACVVAAVVVSWTGIEIDLVLVRPILLTGLLLLVVVFIGEVVHLVLVVLVHLVLVLTDRCVRILDN